MIGGSRMGNYIRTSKHPKSIRAIQLLSYLALLTILAAVVSFIYQLGKVRVFQTCAVLICDLFLCRCYKWHKGAKLPRK